MCHKILRNGKVDQNLLNRNRSINKGGINGVEIICLPFHGIRNCPWILSKDVVLAVKYSKYSKFT